LFGVVRCYSLVHPHVSTDPQVNGVSASTFCLRELDLLHSCG
jgi:hypothetical protein